MEISNMEFIKDKLRPENFIENEVSESVRKRIHKQLTLLLGRIRLIRDAIRETVNDEIQKGER